MNVCACKKLFRRRTYRLNSYAIYSYVAKYFVILRMSVKRIRTKNEYLHTIVEVETKVVSDTSSFIKYRPNQFWVAASRRRVSNMTNKHLSLKTLDLRSSVRDIGREFVKTHLNRKFIYTIIIIYTLNLYFS